MRLIKLFVLMLICTIAVAQHSNKIWCFGDSAGINFSMPNAPTFFSSGMDCRGSSCSIADSTDSLLFYAHTLNYYLTSNIRGAVRNKMHNIMDNGDSIIGQGWYNEMIIIPNLNSPNIYWLFHVEASVQTGIYYSLINMASNGGLGKVVLKNIQLQNFDMFSCTAAIKHGNGRDWWVLFKPSGATTPNNQFYEYLVTPTGIQGPYIYNIGLTSGSDFGQFTFNHIGNKLAFANAAGLLQLFDLDRCSGSITNPLILSQQNFTTPPLFSGIEFSPNDSVMYVTTTTQSYYLFQYNLTAPNIAASKDTIATIFTPPWSGGYLKLAPDGKIYWSIAWYDGVNFNYPYDSTDYNMYNMNLSVINNPNALGTACNFTPFSFYLGGKRTYYGLPNNPDYNLGALTGSVCDTLTSIGNEQLAISKADLHVFYSTPWQKLFVNADGLMGKEFELRIVDGMGKTIVKEEGRIYYGSFSKDVDLKNATTGMYIVTLQTEKERLVKKFVKG
ncbi:MAG: T9SS type A sorting domain-containing protein [Bacteroidetes bacterium]|nr:T9SS type A sorting domain-containing protein [Bacteroidota bacterium]